MKNPEISVIMPVYNTEKYVGEAIESILDQTFTNFEFIIIDDGSTDKSREIIQKYAKKDKRIKALQNKENKKLVYTRNIALSNIDKDSKYIGICDADDKISSTRLEETYMFMESNKDISAVGINLQYIDKNGNKGKELKYPKYPIEKRKVIFKMSPMSHGGSLIRINDRKKIGFHYDESFKRAHDYELWSRFIGNGYKLAGLDSDIRTYHRVFGGEQGKRKYLKLTLKNSMRIQWRLIKKGKIPGINSIFYIIAESLLYILPGDFVFWLFKKIRGAK